MDKQLDEMTVEELEAQQRQWVTANTQTAWDAFQVTKAYGDVVDYPGWEGLRKLELSTHMGRLTLKARSAQGDHIPGTKDEFFKVRWVVAWLDDTLVMNIRFTHKGEIDLKDGDNLILPGSFWDVIAKKAGGLRAAQKAAKKQREENERQALVNKLQLGKEIG